MQVKKTSKQSISKAVKLFKAGKAVVFPTDTSYGLAVDATNSKAVLRMYAIKERSSRKPVHVVVSSLTMAGEFAVVDARARKLAKKFFPGALTILLPLRPPLSPPLMRGRNSGSQSHHNQNHLLLLSSGTRKIGIRIPKNKVALEMVKKLKKPITATSANISGKAGAYSIEEIVSQFKNKKHQPDLILDSGKLKKVKPSTIVDLTAEKPKLIRKGPVKFKDVLNALRA